MQIDCMCGRVAIGCVLLFGASANAQQPEQGFCGRVADASGAARELFQEVDEALSQHLFRIMVEGPDSDLTLTENAQPAIMANAIATLRVLEREGGVSLADKADYVAGHSLGEYSALCAAQAFDLRDVDAPETVLVGDLVEHAQEKGKRIGERAVEVESRDLDHSARAPWIFWVS